MGWVIAGAVVLIGLFVEALIIAPDKLPWNRRRKK